MKGYRAQLLVIALGIIILFVLRLVLGSVYIPLVDLLNPTKIEKMILFDYRLPHALTAIVAGVILSLCGLIMQSIFRNPLAGPFVLGISSGASLVVALFFMTGFSEILSGVGVSFAAILGALSVVILITLVSLKFSDNFTLLIFGLMLGYVFSAVQGFVQYFGEARSLKNFVVWGMGSFGNLNGTAILVLLIIATLLVFVSINVAKKLDFYSLGDDYAKLEGINVAKFKMGMLILVGISAGVLTGYCGPIAFLGLAVPHLAAMICKTKKHKIWILFTVFTGALLALFCDIIAEVPGEDVTFPINVITCMIGAPVVIWVLLKTKRVF